MPVQRDEFLVNRAARARFDIRDFRSASCYNSPKLCPLLPLEFDTIGDRWKLRTLEERS
jgi:hypothetical protein